MPSKHHMLKRKKPSKTLKKAKKPKEKSISKLIKECDAIFSIQTRMKGAEKTQYGLMNRCYTCGNAFEVKRLHAGHYVSRMFKAARWNYDNARPQCFACNIYRKGDAVQFRIHLVAEIGEARVHAVEELRNAPVKLSRDFLTTLLEQLKNQQTI